MVGYKALDHLSQTEKAAIHGPKCLLKNSRSQVRGCSNQTPEQEKATLRRK